MKILTFFMAMLLLINLTAIAGSEGGGGGDAVVLQNGEVVLADVFLDRNQPQPGDMPQRIFLNTVLIKQMQDYADFFKRLLNTVVLDSYPNDKDPSEISKELINLFLGLGYATENLKFYSVKDEAELNTFCASGGKKIYKFPDGASVSQVACTNGNETFLVEALFRKMNLKQQALLLMHERLTTLKDKNGKRSYLDIAGVTSGFGEVVTLTYEQQNGIEKSLSNEQIEKIKNFYISYRRITYRNYAELPEDRKWHIHKNGGGVVRDSAKVSNLAFIGADSSVLDETVIEEGVVAKDSLLSQNVFIEEGSRITSSRLSGKGLIIGQKSQIWKTLIVIEDFHTGAEFVAKNAYIRLDHFKPKFPIGPVKLKDRQQIVDGFISNYQNGVLNPTHHYAPVGYEVMLPRLKGSVRTSCQGAMKKYVGSESSCHSFKTTDFEPYNRYNSFAEDPSGGGLGYNLQLNKSIDRDTGRITVNGKKHYYLLEVLRYFKFDLTFSKLEGFKTPKDRAFTIFEGGLYPAGQLRRYHFSGDRSMMSFLEAIASEARAKGIEVSLGKWNLYLDLPIRKVD